MNQFKNLELKPRESKTFEVEVNYERSITQWIKEIYPNGISYSIEVDLKRYYSVARGKGRSNKTFMLLCLGHTNTKEVRDRFRMLNLRVPDIWETCSFIKKTSLSCFVIPERIFLPNVKVYFCGRESINRPYYLTFHRYGVNCPMTYDEWPLEKDYWADHAIFLGVKD